MHRFVAFQWDPASEARTRQARRWADSVRQSSGDWAIALDRPGLIILALSKRGSRNVIPIPGAHGVVVGVVFERHRERDGPVHELDGRTACRGAKTGDALISGFWGNYVALWQDQNDQSLRVLRDPSGAVPCFRTQSAGVTICCSFIADIAALPGITLSVDWHTLRAFLLHSGFVTPHTGLKEIDEVLPGQMLILNSDGASRSEWAWNAARIAATPHKRDFAGASTDFRKAAEDCFTGWSKAYRSVVIRLSGGLDSSLVACLLAKAGANVTAVHLVGRGYEAFELSLARRTASHAGIELLELELEDPLGDLSALVAGPPLARPSRQVMGAAADKVVLDACHILDADSIMGGHGGDNIFMQRSMAVDMLADYVRLRGPGRDFWRVAYDSSMLLEQSVWQTVRQALAVAIGARRWTPLSFMDEDPAYRAAREGSGIPASYFSHPWLAEAARLPPCKAEQIRGIVALRDYYPVMGHGVVHDAVYPLISQPVAELSIRTPAYLFNQGGKDRALERRTFADLLPAEVVRRTHKGFVNHQLTDTIGRHAGTLREFLFEGHLVSHGVIERVEVEQTFSDDNLGRAGKLAHVLNLVAVEAWLATWRQQLSFSI